MYKELGAWLRGQREDRRWTRAEMARQLIQAGHARGDKHVPGMDGMSHNIYRWERGGPLSERYKLHYCHALGISVSQFGHGQADGHPRAMPATRAVTATFLPGSPASPPDAQLPAAATVAYRGLEGPHMGDSAIMREVTMAAHEGSDHAERAEQRGVGDTTLEQLRADLVRVSREYMTSDPLPMFLEMRRVRNRILEALDRRLWPRDATELYLMAGCLNGLMAAAANNLGYPQSAEELARAGWAYATMIDHRPLMAQLRMGTAYVAYWSGYLRESADLARSGLDYLADGQNAAQLHLYLGLAEAHLGNEDNARRAIAAAHEARDAITTTSYWRLAASSDSRPQPSTTTRASFSATSPARQVPPAPNWNAPQNYMRPGQNQANTTAANAKCSPTLTWPSRGCVAARSTRPQRH